jgi:hypothetical protein
MWNDIDRERLKNSDKNLSHGTGMNPGLHGEKLATTD